MIAALLLLFATPQAATVTFTHPCAHSSVVLAAFGEAIGETIKPTGSVLKDYFLVRFDSMPVEDAKKAIAKALNASWTESGGVHYLTRTGAQELAEEREIRDGLHKAVVEMIAEAKGEAAAQKPLVLTTLVDRFRRRDDDEVSSWLHENSPTNRLDARLTASFTVDELLRLPRGATVFSSNPGLDEFRLTPIMRKLYDEFCNECETWSEARMAAGLTEEDYDFFEDGLTGPDAVVSFQFQVDDTSLWFSMEFSSEIGGGSSGGGGANAENMKENSWYEFYNKADFPAKIEPETVEAWNSIDPNYEQMFGSWDLIGEMPKRKAPCALLRRIVTDIQRNEPLNQLVSWPILQIAENKRVNIVALLPDEAIGWPFSARAIKDGQSLSAVFEECYVSVGAQFDSGLKCWLAYPSNRPAARKARVDRQAFGGLLATIAGQGWLTLDDMAGYVAKSGATSIEQSWGYLLEFAHDVDMAEGRGQVYNNFELATRIYSAIPVAQRKAARQGPIEIPIENWPPSVLRLLQERDWGRDRFNLPNPDPDGWETIEGRMIGAAIHEGLPGGTVLVIKVDPTDLICVSTTEYDSPMELEQIAQIVLSLERGEEYAMHIKGFAVGAREWLTVRIEVPDLGVYVLSDAFHRTPFKDELRPLNQTPASFQRDLKHEVDKLRGG